MSPIHRSPSDAVQAFKDLKAREMIPMHYGTFDLSDEPIGDPIKVLQKLDSDQKIKGKVDYLIPGETLFIDH